MECPHCGNNTSEILKYCEFCGSAIEVEGEDVASGLSAERDADRLMTSERKMRGRLFLAIFIFMSLMAARSIVLLPREVNVHPVFVLPPSLAEAKLKGSETPSLKSEKVELAYPPAK